MARHATVEKQPAAGIALIGCGAVGEVFYAPALRRLASSGHLRVAHLVDPDPARRAALARHFPEARCLPDLGGLEHADLAIVASPPAYHCAQVLWLLERGIDILCEKPMASNSAEARKMVAAADHAQRLLAVGHVRRFQFFTQTVRRMARSGILGRPLSVQVVEGHKGQWPLRSDASFRKESLGVLADIGSHVIDVLHLWFGAMTDVAVWDDAAGGVEANCWLEGTFGDVSVKAFLSRWQKVKSAWVVRFEHGTIRFHPGTPEALDLNCRGLARGELQVQPDEAGSHPFTIEKCFDAQILDALECSSTGRMPMTSGRDAVATIELLERCYTSRRLARMPWLPREECEALQQFG